MDWSNKSKYSSHTNHHSPIQPKSFTECLILDSNYNKQCPPCNWLNNFEFWNVHDFSNRVHFRRKLEFWAGLFWVQTEQYFECEFDKWLDSELSWDFVIKFIVWNNDIRGVSNSLFSDKVYNFEWFWIQCIVFGECTRNSVEYPSSNFDNNNFSKHYCDEVWRIFYFRQKIQSKHYWYNKSFEDISWICVSLLLAW